MGLVGGCVCVCVCVFIMHLTNRGNRVSTSKRWFQSTCWGEMKGTYLLFIFMEGVYCCIPAALGF